MKINRLRLFGIVAAAAIGLSMAACGNGAGADHGACRQVRITVTGIPERYIEGLGFLAHGGGIAAVSWSGAGDYMTAIDRANGELTLTMSTQEGGKFAMSGASAVNLILSRPGALHSSHPSVRTLAIPSRHIRAGDNVIPWSDFN